jgi:glycosyltransferase involved in cell wall biosynthesis
MAKVLVISEDVVGTSMAGPGIRSWEFAQALAATHDVTLATPNRTDLTSTAFAIDSYEGRRVATLVSGYDVVITQFVQPALARTCKREGARLIVDAYDPRYLEALEIHRDDAPEERDWILERMFVEMKAWMVFADGVICASEKQRDLWLGSLLALGRITAPAYLQDVSLRRLVDVVPFGTQDAEPVRTGPGFREQFGIAESDRVLLWGGGIWNWFDPLTLIRAVALLKERRADVKLVFMGLKHPNDRVPEMEMMRRAVALADELGLRDEHVFFNFGWVPYGERQNHFLEADVGLSTHFDHLETRFSFRTRILDYFWTGLPVVATKGDAMADLVLQHDLGRVVEYEDPQGLAEAIEAMLDDEAARAQVVENLREVREAFRWSRVTEPINAMIEGLGPATPRGLTSQELRALGRLYRYTVHDVQSERGVAELARNAATRALGEFRGRR